MSLLSDSIKTIRDALKMADDVKAAGEALKLITQELREHDRRITRLEARWETAMQLSALRSARRIGKDE
ncbi:MAG: hypothetical protein JSS16_00210 [Proteobacteria bacterium]|uniref:hypothetical protein n=1 Tax=Rudaea sp. TaxID=2136325 RepID=UPI001E0B234E|nr:hypothetical protein [Pseudomonadota bacterium]MBS0568308.1 hypothetical protein [Pseudomonadota bacterium]